MLAENRNVAYEVSREIQPNRQTTVAPRQRRALSFSERAVTMASIAVCVAAGWIVASRGAQLDALNYKIDSLQTQIQKSAADNATLSAQVDDLKQPSRILDLAHKLGLVPGNPVQIPAATSGH